MRLLARYFARFVAQTLAGLGTGALLELSTWRALLMGLAANIIPATVTLLERYADTGNVDIG
jgi:hypothetical protein